MIREADPAVTALVDKARGGEPDGAQGRNPDGGPDKRSGEDGAAQDEDTAFARFVSEARFVKDEFEVAELERACAATAVGFSLPSRAPCPRPCPRGAASAGSRASSACTRATWATPSATTPSPRAAITRTRCTGSATTATSATAT